MRFLIDSSSVVSMSLTIERRERAVEAGSSPPRPRSSCRSGTPGLYAALDIASGTITGSLHARHRGGEFVSFLRKIDANVDLT
jgi:hypothetical protein